MLGHILSHLALHGLQDVAKHMNHKIEEEEKRNKQAIVNSGIGFYVFPNGEVYRAEQYYERFHPGSK